MYNKAYKFRIYPNSKQCTLINNTFGCVRFIYNHLLQDKMDFYQNNKTMLKREVSYYKNLFPFLKNVDSLALANSKRNLDTAYKNFFTKKANFPTFHKKGLFDSYTTNMVNNNIKLINNYIKLPKLGFIKIKQHRIIPSTELIKNCTISKKCNKYYISIIVEYDKNITFIDKNTISKDKVLGLDYSSTYLYIDSNGNKANYPKFYRNTQQKLAKTQHLLARKQKYSKNYYKQLLKVQKIHNKISNQRLDFLHKQSNEITNHYDVICFEDINLQSMSRTLKLGKSTLDNGFGMLRTFIKYKANNKGKYVQKVDKFYPSTKRCNKCGYINKKIVLGIKSWECPQCQTVHNRDINAALNIRDEGYRLLLQ